jgi:hypothetical protein
VNLEDLIDACPECDDARNPTWPLTVTWTQRGARCTYRCSAGHEWTCSWADPSHRRSAS